VSRPVTSKTAFWDAVKNHWAQDVAAALRSRPEFGSLVDDIGRTPLHFCARQSAPTPAKARAAVATARVLVKAGLDPHAIHSIADDGEIFPASTLWHALVLGRNLPLTRYFLKLKVDPNRCMFGLVYADDLSSAKLLRKHGAQVDDVGLGETPLIYAIRQSRVKFAEWLLREGADARFKDRRGFTALHHAVRRRLPDSTLRLLVASGADVNAVSTDRRSVAQLATRAQKRLLGLT
jgi:ankyrin repeat protein